MIQNFIKIILGLGIAFPAIGQVSPPRPSPFGNSGGNNFYVGLDRGKPLVRISLLNGVSTPGIYHVPINTSISELLSYAGGATSTSDLSEISIRRSTKDGEHTTVRVDLDEILGGNESLPLLQDKDIVYIAQKETLDNTIKWLTLASLAASVVSAIIVINDDD